MSIGSIYRTVISLFISNSEDERVKYLPALSNNRSLLLSRVVLDSFRPFNQYLQDCSLHSPTQSPSLYSPDLSLSGWITYTRKGTLIPSQINIFLCFLWTNRKYHLPPNCLTNFQFGELQHWVPLLYGKRN